MNSDRQQAINYLRAPAAGLWRWAENGAVLVWHDGSTIAFREEIVQVLEWLAPNGLPSFGAIVFLLAACRAKVPNVADIIIEANKTLPSGMGDDAVLLVAARKQLKAQLDAALTELGKVSRFPAELNSHLAGKCVLAEAVFERANAERHVSARTVLRGFREPMTDADLLDSERGHLRGSYIRQIHIVAEGLKPHTPESMVLRQRTGLNALPKEIEANLSTAERARRLIDELSRDREHGAVARAARELMAAVRLPRRLGKREQLAIGGVADITNRGPLDRLLMSELAHDDLTLSVRVALNEALYLRREPPMREPPGTLALLLDSGLRLWGVPRVLATAVALALIARDKQHREVRVWRAHGKELQPVDLLSRQGLTQQLSALETTAHPGESVPAFAEALSPGAQNQSVLITHRDALADPEFRRLLGQNPDAPGFIAAVDREGRFELHALPLARRPALCEADLDLASVFDDRIGASPIKVDSAPNLPAIFGVVPFPFLLPLAGRFGFWIKASDGFIYSVLNDRRLVQFRDQRSGALVLASDLPGGRTIWMDCIDGSLHVVKVGSNDRPARLLSLGLPHGRLSVTDLTGGSEVLAVHRYGDAILVIHDYDTRAYALSDGRLLGQAANPHPWVSGRFFRSTTDFYFAVWDGERVKFEPVTMPKSVWDDELMKFEPVSRMSNPFSPSVILQIFDREGIEGPWFVHRSGMVVSTATGEHQNLPMPPGRAFGLDKVRVSRDGHRVHFLMSSPEWRGSKDLISGKVFDVPDARRGIPEMDNPPGMPRWNMYRIFESVARLNDGIALCGRKERWRKLSVGTHESLRITELASPRIDLGATFASASFGEPSRITDHGCTLQCATFPGGSKVLLDSRGLLHLKSSDPTVAEVTLVLADSEVAGWTSDGYVCGPAFFFGRPYTSEPMHVFERMMRFLSRL